ncbi:hypothetical protein Y032_1102g3606, partial [Ancylostoma ceylanicum]
CHIYGGSTCPPPRTVILSFCVLVPAFQKNSLFMNPEVIPAENGVAYEDLHRGLPSSAQSGPSTGSSNGMELRVLTLNVWCLPQPWPIGSKDRKFRLKKLAEAILDENLDIVGLQEVWSETDYLDMVDRLSGSFRFNHYFHSGFTGSGVCVFSRHPIVSTLTHRYSLNGFAHHIHRGDWFGGKVMYESLGTTLTRTPVYDRRKSGIDLCAVIITGKAHKVNMVDTLYMNGGGEASNAALIPLCAVFRNYT